MVKIVSISGIQISFGGHQESQKFRQLIFLWMLHTFRLSSKCFLVFCFPEMQNETQTGFHQLFPFGVFFLQELVDIHGHPNGQSDGVLSPGVLGTKQVM